MNNLLRSVLVLLTIALSASAQENQVSFTIHGRIGDAPFVINSMYRTLADDLYLKPTSLRYYLSQISITHDGGKVTPIPSLYILVDHSAPTSYQLGTLPITSVESITFHIGVDSARNHLDPATYAPYHPLSPQDPSMHWGWTSGYKFMAYNLLTGADTAAMKYVTEIHGLGDANYYRITVDVPVDARNGKVSIDVIANLAELLRGINVSKSLFEHSDEGPAKLMLENAAQRVFSAATITSVSDAPFSEDAWREQGGMVSIYDMQGGLVRSCTDTMQPLFNGLRAGVYVVVRSTVGRAPHHTLYLHDGE